MGTAQRRVATAPAIETGHIVQLFDDTESLATTVGDYLSEGWHAGETLLVVATAEHWGAIRDRLEALHVPVVAALESERLTACDARATLDRFTRHERLDSSLFEACVGRLVRTLSARGRPVRIFGEMVDVLAATGDFAGAEQLEGFWHRLAAQRPFSLFCGYSAATFGDPRSRGSLRRICSAHDGVRSSRADLLGSFLVEVARGR